MLYVLFRPNYIKTHFKFPNLVAVADAEGWGFAY